MLIKVDNPLGMGNDNILYLNLSDELLMKTLMQQVLPHIEKQYAKVEGMAKVGMQQIARNMLYKAEREAEDDETRKFIRPKPGDDPVLHFGKVLVVGLVGLLEQSEIYFKTDLELSTSSISIVSIDLKFKSTGKERR